MDNIEHQKVKIHSEDLQDIISKPPSWLLKWGISVVLIVLISLITLSAFIRYPDIVNASIKINAVNAPKALVPKISGTLVRLLVKDRTYVENGTVLAWMESSASHQDVLDLSKKLISLRDKLNNITANFYLNSPNNLNLGELQGVYQAFYQSYLTYQSAISGGIYLRQKTYLIKEMIYEQKQQEKLSEQRRIYEKDFLLAERRYNAYRTLADKKVISPMELQEKESIFLSKQQPLYQISANQLSSESNYIARQKELAELENKIHTEKTAFIQSLNSFISEIEQWKKKYILTANQKGVVMYSGIVQEKQYIESNEPLFYINPGNMDYFAEAYIRQNNMGKVRRDQRVLVKMNSYPFEEFGAINGKISTITDIPYQDSVYLSRVLLIPAPKDTIIKLKIGMTGTASIITDDASLLKRLVRNVTKLVIRERK